MGFIDIHSHILPNVDDGAKDLFDSLELLKQEKEHGVSFVCCTPHFYPEFHSLDEYLQKSQAAFRLLGGAMYGGDYPQIAMGSEIHYFPGISRCSGLEKCLLADTHYLLLELPFLSHIPSEAIGEISRLSEDIGFTVVLAHLERCCRDVRYRSLIKLVKNSDVLVQINADSLFFEETNKATERLLKENLVSFVASDAHSPKLRPVRLAPCLAEIKNRFPHAYSKICESQDTFSKQIGVTL